MNGFLVALGVLAAGLFIVGWVRARLADPPRSALMESIPILLAGLILYLAFWIGIVAVVIGTSADTRLDQHDVVAGRIRVDMARLDKAKRRAL